MGFLRVLSGLAIILLFVGTSIASITGLAKVLTPVISIYLLKVESCEFNYAASEKKCSVDYNGAKRSIAEGLGLFLAAAPVAALLSKPTFSRLQEINEKQG